MKIIAVQPQPFYAIRGTPISTMRMLDCMLQDGHKVDIVTFPFGTDIEHPNLRFIRCWKPPFIDSMPIGPSFRKLILDFFLFWTVLRQLRREKYDVFHANEEATIFGYPLVKAFKIPMVYDMDSYIPDQLSRHPFFKFPPIVAMSRFFEKKAIQLSCAITTVCADLTVKVHEIDPDKKVYQIEDVPLNEETPPLSPEKRAELLKEFNANGEKLIFYTGNLEKYQGIELLLKSIAVLIKYNQNFRLILVGGEADQIENLKRDASVLGIGKHVFFAGKKPIEEATALLECADVLVSPRIEGTNTPFKLYSYMQTGIPIVATDLHMHRQALDGSSSVLTAPEPEAFGKGLLKVLENPQLGKELGLGAQKIIQERFNIRLFNQKTREMYEYVTQKERVTE